MTIKDPLWSDGKLSQNTDNELNFVHDFSTIMFHVTVCSECKCLHPTPSLGLRQRLIFLQERRCCRSHTSVKVQIWC